MDNKSILEEQIRELQKIQDNNIKDNRTSGIVDVSHAILELV